MGGAVQADLLRNGRARSNGVPGPVRAREIDTLDRCAKLATQSEIAWESGMRRKPSLGTLRWDKKPSLDELADYPGMTSWFNPKLLGQLLLRVIISDVFGQYADRRLIEAALDPATKIDIQQRDDLSDVLPKDAGEGAIWIDFVADLGDGFDATYAVAYLLAQDNLAVGGETLPRGVCVVHGR